MVVKVYCQERKKKKKTIDPQTQKQNNWIHQPTYPVSIPSYSLWAVDFKIKFC